jgi:hypothetical protein
MTENILEEYFPLFVMYIHNIDSWTEHFCSIVENDQQNASSSQWILLM